MRNRWQRGPDNPELVQRNRARLLTVFKQLRKENVIARANFLCCSGCAHCDLATIATKDNKKGWVFWHHQDNERLQENGTVMLGFGGAVNCNVPPAAAVETLAVGQRVRDLLVAADLAFDWDGTADMRINVNLNKATRQPQTIAEAMAAVVGL